MCWNLQEKEVQEKVKKNMHSEQKPEKIFFTPMSQYNAIYLDPGTRYYCFRAFKAMVTNSEVDVFCKTLYYLES